MKTKRTNLILKIRGFIYFPFLALAMLFLYSLTLHSSETRNIGETFQQEKITIKGKVLDNNNDGLDGVLVKDENSDIKIETNGVGEFTLVLNEPTVVHFIKLGFEAQKKEIAENDSNLVVIMIPESNEMIVKGFDIEKKSIQDAQRKLDSLSAIPDNYPLYIIDDLQKERDFDIKSLNRDDVISIEVLNDSVAKEHYGLEGQRGAVKITTKNTNKMDIQAPMQLNNNDSASQILKDKYQMYKDTMNARNARLRERNRKVSNSKTVMPTQQELPIDSVDSLNKKDLEVKMENQMDTTMMKGMKEKE